MSATLSKAPHVAILTNIVAAEEDEVQSVGESLRPMDEWSGIEKRGIDTAKIAIFHCLLTGDELDQALGRYEPVYIGSEGAVVLRIADEFLDRLASFEDEALERVAEELAATEEFEMEQWDPDEVLDLVTELADLARLAEAQGQVLLVWMHPLLT